MSSQRDVLQTKLSGKVARFLKKRNVLLPDEVIEAVLVGGTGSQAILITSSRLIVVKVGVMTGSTGGGRVTSFDYCDVVALQVQLGVLMGSLSVQSKGYGATQVGDYWDLQKDKRVLDLPNTIVWSKPDDKKYAAELAYAHAKIADAHGGIGAPASVPPISLSDELVRLADLHASGVLTDEEFAAAKAHLLSG